MKSYPFLKLLTKIHHNPTQGCGLAVPDGSRCLAFAVGGLLYAVSWKSLSPGPINSDH